MSLRCRLLIGCLLWALSGMAQNPPLKIIRSTPSVQANDAFLKVNLGLSIPIVADTAHALNNGLDSLGLVVQIFSTGDWWKRIQDGVGGKKWALISSGGGSGTDTATLEGPFIKITRSGNQITIKGDTAAMHLIWPFFSDSTKKYITLKQLKDSLAVVDSISIVISNDSLYLCISGVCSFQDTIAGTTDASLLISGILNAARIGANSITNAKLATMANSTIKGRVTAGTGSPEDLTAAQVASIINGSIVIAESQVSGLTADLAAKVANNGASTGIKAALYSARPAASTCNCYYVATDSAKLYYDNGAWITIGGGSGSSAPSGPAGGDLAGTYPNPTIGANKVTLGQQATNTANGLQGWDGSGNPARVIIDAPLQLIGGHLKDTSTSSGGGGGMIPLTNAHVYVGNASNVATDVAVSGDVTITNTGATAIGTNKVANTQAAQMPANTTKGNNTGSLANAADLTAPQEVANLGAATAGQRVMTDPTTGALATQAEVLHQPVKWATAAALPANTYSNGTAGVGATLTATSNGALSIDGNAVTAADRVLIKDEVTQSHNGLYTVTQAGSGGTPYILTRGAYSSIAGNMAAGSHVYVQGGTVNATHTFFQTTAGTITFGTTALNYQVTPLPFVGKADLLAGTGLGLYGIVAAGSTGAVLTWDPAQPTGLRFALQPTINLVTDVAYAGGAKHDGQLATDAAMLVGTAIVVSSQATFAAGDVGKPILIKGVGASGNDTLTSITGFADSHHVTVAVNASTGGGGHIIKWGTNDGPAFQAGLNALYAVGGGVLKVPSAPKGNFYFVTSALNHSDNTGHDPNAQIWFPSESFPEVTSPDSVPYVIKIEGEVKPNVEYGALDNDSSQIRSGGCMIVSGLTASFGQGAVIGAGAGFVTPFGSFSAVTCILENIDVQVPDGLRGAYRSGIDFNLANLVQLKNCNVKTDVPALQAHTPAFHTFGLRMPQVGAGVEQYLDGLNSFQGFESGAVISEHVSAQILSVQCNLYGVMFVQANHASHISTLKAQWNGSAIYADSIPGSKFGPCPVYIDQLDIEAISAVGHFYSYVHSVNDSLHLMKGLIGWQFSPAGIGPATVWNPTTTNAVLAQYGDQLRGNYLLLGGASKLSGGSLPAGVGAAGNPVVEIWNGNNATGSTDWAQLLFSNKQNNASSEIGDLRFINRQGNATVGQIIATTGANITSGIIYARTWNTGTLVNNLILSGTNSLFGTPITPWSRTTTQQNAISSPIAGMYIWNSDSLALMIYTGSAWAKVGGGSGGGGASVGNLGDFQLAGPGGTSLSYPTLHVDTTTRKVGIGTQTPLGPLHVNGLGGTKGQLVLQDSVGSGSTSTVWHSYVGHNGTRIGYFGFPNLIGGTDVNSYWGNEIATGNLVFVTSGGERMRLTNGGTLLLGGLTTSPGAYFAIGAGTTSIPQIVLTSGPPATTKAAGQISQSNGLYIADSSSSKRDTFATRSWVLNNAPGGGGAVSSVFGRTGAVAATSGDYTVAQVTGAAPLASPTFTGTPAAPTASAGNNSIQVATTAYVDGLASSANFTSTWTNTTNISSSTFSVASYLKVGNIVFVTLNGTMTHTTNSINTVLTFTLPLTTSTTSQSYCGSATFEANSGLVYDSGLVSVVSGTTGQVQITPSSTGGGPINIRLQYKLN